MAAQIGHIAQLLDATLDQHHHKKGGCQICNAPRDAVWKLTCRTSTAEQALKVEEGKPQFSLILLQIVASDPLPLKTRLSAALCFKNFIRHNYVDEEGTYKLPEDEVNTLKQELIGLMISSPPSIQTQLGEAISVIADSDFWRRWDTLVEDLVNKLSSTDPKVTNGVLEVAHSIFVRWRPLFRSNELFEEVNHVLGSFSTLR